ncbi:hypothetical protein A3D83_04755 [Candidatus Daviesbacteria bacterium RIFCSPHIGHO2_02_FULL_41_10]|uniref:NYN domain-containing protein n=2 Tax=Candidatus Daviesiibacteriota TaxID=1752718 RepID=A0A1F5IRX9_9BACT|nr:MAG: hypothetical protein A2871_01300 [Candidatus Daviesbacteria bacterium RIFCSPHIGHO2_01_FULL_41_23]OGE33915.1 MAG: hypothetical protein A3D83_04755 [Candidatus Daviesbacteria bacterium RIFCSPHIGHO2_02_FULL_41_10]
MKKIPKIYAFIDSQNLNLGVRSQGWKLDFRKFRQYLRNKYGVSKAFLFLGYLPGNETLYTQMQEMGYLIILKPTMKLPDKTVKGNVDAELVLHTMIQYKDYDKAIIVSGDGDFHCLVEYLVQKDKLLRLLTPNQHYSRLFKEFSSFIVQVNWIRNNLELKKDWHQRSVETLGLSSHRDKSNLSQKHKRIKRKKGGHR